MHPVLYTSPCPLTLVFLQHIQKFPSFPKAWGSFCASPKSSLSLDPGHHCPMVTVASDCHLPTSPSLLTTSGPSSASPCLVQELNTLQKSPDGSCPASFPPQPVPERLKSHRRNMDSSQRLVVSSSPHGVICALPSFPTLPQPCATKTTQKSGCHEAAHLCGTEKSLFCSDAVWAFLQADAVSTRACRVLPPSSAQHRPKSSQENIPGLMQHTSPLPLINQKPPCT